MFNKHHVKKQCLSFSLCRRIATKKENCTKKGEKNLSNTHYCCTEIKMKEIKKFCMKTVSNMLRILDDTAYTWTLSSHTAPDTSIGKITYLKIVMGFLLNM